MQASRQVILFARAKLVERYGRAKEADAIMAFRKKRKQGGLNIFSSKLEISKPSKTGGCERKIDNKIILLLAKAVKCIIELLKGDCLEVMKEIPDKSIDMILCDLPYGVTQNKKDIIIPFDKLWKHYERIIKDNGAILLFGQGAFYVDLVNGRHCNLVTTGLGKLAES